MKKILYATASAVASLALLASGTSMAFAQAGTTTYHGGHDYGHGGNDFGGGQYGNGQWNSNHTHNWNGNSWGGNGWNGTGNYGDHWHGNDHDFHRDHDHLYFLYGGHQYFGAEYVYTGQAFNVGPNSFTIYINGVPYLVYYATGYQTLNNAGGSIGTTGILPGDYVRVDGVYLNGVIYARYVQDLSL